MDTRSRNYSVKHIGSLEGLLANDFNGVYGKHFTRNELGLTGCEVSLNCIPAGTGVQFVHSHQKNEALYIVFRGNGIFFVDEEEFPIQEGSLIRVDPAGERALRAGSEDMYYICVQAEAGSLTQATFEDGIKLATRTSWM
jgi:mannose-6-phosphate isomerase-like protein (cupin superfamily)